MAARSYMFMAAFAAIHAVAFTALADTPAVYDADPQHLWNRLFAAFYVRQVEVVDRPVVDGDAERGAPRTVVLGPDVLDPPLGRHARFLLDDAPFRKCNEIMDEFLSSGGAQLVDDPLKRVLLQRDLWAVFDVLQADPKRVSHGMWLEGGLPELTPVHLQHRQILSRKLAAIMRAVALSAGQVRRLPDTYQLAVDSRAFRTEPEGSEPPHYLPADLFDPHGAWQQIVYGEAEGGLFGHTHQTDGRSVFRVFWRLPEPAGTPEQLQRWLTDRQRSMQALRASLDQLPVEGPERQRAEAEGERAQEDFPLGSRFVLLRQLICLDDQFTPVATGIVESVQIRVVLASIEPPAHDIDQLFESFEMNRLLLLAGQRGGLHPTHPGSDQFYGLSLLGRLHTGPEGRLSVGRPFPDNCTNCHLGRTLSGESTIQATVRSLRQGVGVQSPRSTIQAERTIRWKQQRDDFQRLREYWNDH
ncbi:MAG: hypothetical protein IH988_02750 [Planctomycetes bacterium]|nr:hypothetical protein [Planctomycetota bacterium]